jgi:23S rRNA (adenine2503-C2)-methyltransferase
MSKELLFGKSLKELEPLVIQMGMQQFVARQVCDWLYKKHVSSVDEMTNLSVKIRAELKNIFDIGRNNPVSYQESNDGTKKYLFKVLNGKFIEAVFIPEKSRATLCISTQVGCKMGCKFCMTGQQGFHGNLFAGEILNQISSLPERDKLTNIVYMGMGEPFDNLDEVLKSLEILTAAWGYGLGPKRITVSTIGLLKGIKRYIQESNCHLAISLHTPFDEERIRLMPIQKTNPINSILAELRKYDFGLQRRISFEYIMFKGINDTPAHVKELAKLLNGLRCRINLIKFHKIPGSDLESSEDKTIASFNKSLNDSGTVTTMRKSRGQDILAACGLLSTKNKV